MSALPAKIALTENLPDPTQPTLQRFISRDQLHPQNRNDYAAGSPTVLVDVTGLEPTTPTGGEHIGGGIYKYGPHSCHNNGEGYPGSAAPEAALATIKANDVDCPKRNKKTINQVFAFGSASDIANLIVELAGSSLDAAPQRIVPSPVPQPPPKPDTTPTPAAWYDPCGDEWKAIVAQMHVDYYESQRSKTEREITQKQLRQSEAGTTELSLSLHEQLRRQYQRDSAIYQAHLEARRAARSSRFE